MGMEFLTNIYLWMGLTFVFLILFILLFIVLFMIAKKTHGIKELKATLKGIPLCMFFNDSGYVEWKPIKPEAGLITDKDYGTYIINETGSYVDKTTKNIILPFDSQFASSVNIAATKVADDIQMLFKNPETVEKIRKAILTEQLDEASLGKLQTLKTSVQISKIRAMMTAMIPHNITSKIQKAVAAEMMNKGKVDGMQAAIIFAAILGAIIVGYILLKSVGGV